jgi:GNAT superfamily N-acetyltransferase
MKLDAAHASIRYREALRPDIPEMARIWGLEKMEGGTSEDRMVLYFAGQHHPQQALPPRVIYVAHEGNDLIGYIAGHLTRRFGCDGELQWIYVRPRQRRSGVASSLLLKLADWFTQQHAARICVNVARSNAVAHAFYASKGAEVMNQHWLGWEDIAALLVTSRAISGRLSTDLR